MTVLASWLETFESISPSQATSFVVDEGRPLTAEENTFLLSIGYRQEIIDLTPNDTMRRRIAEAKAGSMGMAVAEMQTQTSSIQEHELGSASVEAFGGFIEGFGEAAAGMASTVQGVVEGGFKGLTGLLANAPLLIAAGLGVALLFLLKR